MSKKWTILTHSQWIGVILLFLILALIFIVIHLLPTREQQPPLNTTTTQDSLILRHTYYSDSIYAARTAHYDSLRAIKSAYYDSLHLVRRDSLHQLYQAHRDSIHLADSLWWDSIHNATPRSVKKDTLLALNTADTTELKLIRGIGAGMARRIVRYRQQLGGFVSVKQLQDDALYQDQYGHSIRSRYELADSVLNAFTVDASLVQPIPINHASIERLQAHPYISYTLAKEIYTLRRQRVTLKNSDEIRQLPHMNDSLFLQLLPYLSFEK